MARVREADQWEGALRGSLSELRDLRLWAVAATVGAITMMWTTYNDYVPQFLRGTFGLPAIAVTLVMTADNLLGFLLEPVTGLLSDRTRSRLGQRLPWLLAAMPVAVVCLALLPLPVLLVPASLVGAREALGPWLNPFALFVTGMLVAMALFRTPTVALMPDLAASPERNVANGLLQLLSGLGALAALWLGAPLVARFGPAAPFWLASGVMIAAALFLWAVRPAVDSTQPLPTPSQPLAVPPITHDLALLLGAIGAWWLGFVILSARFGDVAAGRWGIEAGAADFALEWLLFVTTVAAIPVGVLADRAGRRRVLLLSTMSLLALALLLLAAPLPPAALPLLVLGGGLGWAGVVVVSLPMLLDLGVPTGSHGTRTGLYYLAFATAGLAGPWLLRVATPVLGAAVAWLMVLWWAVALVCLLLLAPGAGEARPH